MAHVSKSRAFPVSADSMWSRIGDFHRLQSWMSGIEREERIDDGKRRRLTLGGGMQMVEGLVNKSEREYSYSIDEGPLPITNYVATLRVRDAGKDACVVEWESKFEPNGVPEEQAVAIVETIYDSALNGLDAR